MMIDAVGDIGIQHTREDEMTGNGDEKDEALAKALLGFARHAGVVKFTKPEDKSEGDLLTIPQLARKLSCSPDSLYRLAASGAPGFVRLKNVGWRCAPLAVFAGLQQTATEAAEVGKIGGQVKDLTRRMTKGFLDAVTEVGEEDAVKAIAEGAAVLFVLSRAGENSETTVAAFVPIPIEKANVPEPVSAELPCYSVRFVLVNEAGGTLAESTNSL